jgi:hypothetical protein
MDLNRNLNGPQDEEEEQKNISAKHSPNLSRDFNTYRDEKLGLN